MKAIKRTEFQAVIAYGLYALLNKFGASPEVSEEAVSSFSHFSEKLGDDPISTIVLGIVVGVYVWCRTKRKNLKDTLEAKYHEKG